MKGLYTTIREKRNIKGKEAFERDIQVYVNVSDKEDLFMRDLLAMLSKKSVCLSGDLESLKSLTHKISSITFTLL